MSQKPPPQKPGATPGTEVPVLCKRDYPHAFQALWKALDRAEDLIQD
jgi:hypothetical protein